MLNLFSCFLVTFDVCKYSKNKRYFIACIAIKLFTWEGSCL